MSYNITETDKDTDLSLQILCYIIVESIDYTHFNYYNRTWPSDIGGMPKDRSEVCNPIFKLLQTSQLKYQQ